MLKNVNFYEILNCKPTSTWIELKKAYRDLIKVAHPDKGGSAAFFNSIREAKEILLDQSKRLDYDFSFTNVSAILNHKKIGVNINLKQILGDEPLHLKYIRKIACECKGIEEKCKYCLGTGIREDEVELKLDDVSRQKNTSKVTLPAGGDIDRYGRQADLHVILNYELPIGFHVDSTTKWFLDYNFKLKDYELLDCFDFTIKKLILKIKDLGNLELDTNVFDKNKKVKIKDRINVYVKVEITDINLLLESNYLTELTKHNL